MTRITDWHQLDAYLRERIERYQADIMGMADPRALAARRRALTRVALLSEIRMAIAWKVAQEADSV